MSRVVFSVVALQQPDGISLGIQLTEPATFGRRSVPLGLSPDAPEFRALRGVPPVNAVRDAGRLLFDAVMANQDLAPHLASALLVQSPERCPVFVELTTTGAESFPWEALCSTSGDFLGLDERWAVGRIVETISPVPGNWLFEPPLRVGAVLSCLGVPAAEEWASLRAACEATTLPLEVLVLVSEESLQQEIAAAGLDWVRVEFVPSTVSDLAVRLQQFDAHVLHLFCHGLSTETSPHLQIAVRSDWLTGEGSSLLVEARDIRTFNPAVGGRPWLVVLNSCETAAAEGSASARSVALDLIYEGGVPAVVGMREPVRSDDATVFTRAFYDQLLPQFAAILVPGHPGGPLDWARLVVNARHQLADQYEPLSSQRGTQKEWTMPVVYTRPPRAEGRPTAAQPPPPASDLASDPVTEPATGPAAGPTVPESESSLETTRSIVLSIEALTGLRAQVEGSGDQQMLADIDHELSGLIDRLEAR